MKVNQKILQQKLSRESGQVVTLRDLINISLKMMTGMTSTCRADTRNRIW